MLLAGLPGHHQRGRAPPCAARRVPQRDFFVVAFFVVDFFDELFFDELFEALAFRALAPRARARARAAAAALLFLLGFAVRSGLFQPTARSARNDDGMLSTPSRV